MFRTSVTAYFYPYVEYKHILFSLTSIWMILTHKKINYFPTLFSVFLPNKQNIKIKINKTLTLVLVRLLLRIQSQRVCHFHRFGPPETEFRLSVVVLLSEAVNELEK